MDRNSNAYTFLYASVMVIVVAAVLAFTAIKLQPIQEKNVEIEKKQNILSSVGIQSTPETAEKLFEQYITDSYVIDSEGNKKANEDAFTLKLKKQLIKPIAERSLPIFECKKEDGTFIIIPVLGKGLWGPIWGYIALENDFNTIYGAVFDHKGETPGLGADINKPWFQDPFKGKTLFEGDKFVSITVYKGGKGAAKMAGDTKHGVDAISGGTITSKGLEDMLLDCLISYEKYLKKNRK